MSTHDNVWSDKSTTARLAKTQVPKVGIEPTLPGGNRILSPARLPIPPLRRPLIVDRSVLPCSLPSLKTRRAHEILAPSEHLSSENGIGLEEAE